jgi:RHS repeat-associated protein
LFWRAASVVTVAALIGCDPAFDRLWTAQAQLVPPPQEDPDATRVTEYRYDLDGRLVQVDSPEGTINYGYHAATGRLARTWTDSSETTYSYDKVGRLEIVKAAKRNGNPVSEETRYTYTKVGSRETVTLPNGVVTAYQYDSLNRLTNLTHSVGGTNLLASYTYQLHPTGRRTNAVEIIKTEDTQVPWITNHLSWQFDGMYRMTNEASSSTLASGCFTNAFAYDKVGNRRTKTHIAGTSTNVTQYQYNANDQLTQEVSTINGASSTNSYGYDLNGSLTSKTENGSTIVYTYSLANKLNSVAANDATNSFLYNDGGIRVRITSSSGTTTRYLIDPNNHTGYAQVLEESSSAGVLSRSYVIGDDVLGQRVGSSAPGWLLYDGHGSTRQLVANDGQIAKQFNYSAYGETLGEQFTPANQPETSLLYCGEQIDVDLQMYNLRARFYSPSSGRFNAIDSFAGNDFDPQSLHKYAYCNGDPVNGIDLSGEFTVVEVLVAIVIVAILVAGCGKPPAAARRRTYPGRPISTNFWAAYANVSYDTVPPEDAVRVWQLVGGNLGAWGATRDSNGHVQESCATRLSYALNAVGDGIPSIPNGVTWRNSDGRRYIIRAGDMHGYLTSIWQQADGSSASNDDVRQIESQLAPGQCAIFATRTSPGHSGVIRRGYHDPYVGGFVVDYWIINP